MSTEHQGNDQFAALGTTTPAAAASLPGPGVTSYITSTFAATLGVDPTMLEATITDANAVYGYISANPWVTRDELITWAEGLGATIDRLNSALTLLTTTSRIFAISG